MRTIHFCALGACLSMSSVVIASVYTVNNSIPSPGQYTTIVAAIAATVDGDTLMVAGTGINYGDATVDKAITIIGPGRAIAGNGYSKAAQFNNLILTASNIRLIGIRANTISSNSPNPSLSNMVVQRCIIDLHISVGVDNWISALIEGNVFSAFNTYNLTAGGPYGFLSSNIRNNVFEGIIYFATNTAITNNLFLTSPSAGPIQITSSSVTNGTFEGNIAINRQLASVVASNNVSGNLSLGGTGAWAGAGNITNVDPMFVNYAASTVHTWSYDYHLQPGSPAIGAGPSGEDIGIYAGDGVFRMDGEPSTPIIRAVNVPGGAVVPANATFNVNIISVAHE